jgi:hypothetical protein
MIQYKCLADGFTSFVKGEIYNEDFPTYTSIHITVKDIVQKYPGDWELVDTLTFPREMLVSDNSSYKKRIVISYLGDKYVYPWVTQAHNDSTRTINWRYAKELPKYGLPVIHNRTGIMIANNEAVKYGCIYASIAKLRNILDNIQLSANDSIISINIGGHWEFNVTIKEIKEIMKHVDNLKQ